MRLLFRLADNRDPRSIAGRLRQRRFELLKRLLDTIPRPFRILDVGGSQGFWNVVAPSGLEGVTVVLLNISPQTVSRPGFESVEGDARSLSAFPDHAFEIVFSNSVIEHVGSRDDQRRMANEIQRVGARYFVQTPNRMFPIEPHFLMPGFQFLPVSMRVGLLRRFRLGWYPRVPDRAEARRIVESIELLTEAELVELFPGATLHRETFAGLTKSLIAIGGFDRLEL